MIKNNYLALLLMKQYLVIALVFYTLAYVSAWGIGRPPVEVSVTTTQPTVDSLDTITIKISIKNLSDKIVKIDRRGWDPNLPHYGKILAIKSTEKAETHGLSIRAPGNIHHYYDRVPIGFGDLLPPDAHIAISENSTEELIHILEPHSEDLRYISLIDPGNYEIIYAPALYSGELSQLKVGSRSVQTSTTIQIKSPSKQKMDPIKDARDLRSLLLLARFHHLHLWPKMLRPSLKKNGLII